MTLSQATEAYLLLEDGARFEGTLAGAPVRVAGELVFTTNLTGYQEVLTDPSYAAQIVVMTAPMIGNYGVFGADDQSRRPWVAGFVVRELSRATSGWRAEGSLREYLARHAIATLTGADTRAITRHIRSAGAMRAVIVPASVPVEEARAHMLAEPPMRGRDLVSKVTVEDPYELEAIGAERGLVLCLDFGVKQRSLDLLRAEGYRVRVVPACCRAKELLAAAASGVYVSNGPGDPEAVPGGAELVRSLSDAGLPVFGICLGHQVIARAFGGRTYKLPYGHRGGNHPVRNLDTGAVEITSQNHGFAVVAEGEGVAGAPELRVTHRNLNDGTIEGIAHRERPVFGVQYHPESAPGPHDSRYLFERFVEAMHLTRAMASD
ncbi:MAG: glutamine-hydrolyzing carbamoyl-phosphate synthase small subunit [Gemmatimonadota bacterium]